MSGKRSVLLQTAICSVLGNNSRTVLVKALLDPASQQTYIATKLVKILNLKPLREMKITVKKFACEEKSIDAKEYEIQLKDHEGGIIPIKAVAVPRICETIGEQVVQTAVKMHPFIRTPKLL